MEQCVCEMIYSSQQWSHWTIPHCITWSVQTEDLSLPVKSVTIV